MEDKEEISCMKIYFGLSISSQCSGKHERNEKSNIAANKVLLANYCNV